MQPRADRGSDAVGADEHVGRDITCDGVDDDAGSVVGEPRDPGAGPHGIAAQPLTYRGEQQHLQAAAVNRQLRVRIPGRQAARFDEQQRTVGAVVADRRRGHGSVRDDVPQSQTVQLAHGVGEQVEADTQRAQLSGALEHDDVVETALLQEECRGEAADPGAGDGDGVGHGSSLGPPEP
ncbi:hypothetical protein MHAS_01664 [Mycolicibacterium hassiacum DSM 44199]|nr:hypothetical protein [Mycolicibacterium hassiacum DSM 44199]VCT89964.1 hypothetical protein MHAS_01664 [Mycolicibacterium hassiacum DSM 44199]